MSEQSRSANHTYVSTLWDDPSFRPLVLKLLDRLPEHELDLRRAIESDDIVRVADVAHKIKGALGLHGFPEVVPFAAAVSSAVAEGQSSVVRDRVDDLITALKGMRLRDERS